MMFIELTFYSKVLTERGFKDENHKVSVNVESICSFSQFTNANTTNKTEIKTMYDSLYVKEDYETIKKMIEEA